MGHCATGIVWGKSSRARVSRAATLPQQTRSNSSSTSVRIATRSAQSSTSTGMIAFCRRHRAWFAVTATPLWPWNPSRPVNTTALGVRNGTRCDFQRSQFLSKCTTSPWHLVIAASVERCQLGGSWTCLAVNAGATSENCEEYGQRTATKLKHSARLARTISGPSHAIRKRRLRNRNRIWSIPVRIASDLGPSMQRSCFGTKAWPSVPSAAGLGILRSCPKGSSRQGLNNLATSARAKGRKSVKSPKSDLVRSPKSVRS